MIATTFPVGKSRNKAMAVYGAMSALGITLGVLLGGVLTALLSWRFFINVPLGLAVLAGTRALVEGTRSKGRLDTPGALSGSVALFALAFSLTRAGEHGWSDALTAGGLLIAAVLMAVFVWWQSRVSDPLLPLSLFSDSNRSGSYVAMLLGGASLMGSFYLLTLYLQHVLHFSPLKTGLASLPFSIGIVLGAGISSKFVERLAPRVVAGLGSLVSAIGIFWFSRLSVDSAYLPHVLPSVFLTSLGWATMALTMMLTAVHGVAPPDRAGVASALVNMAQQIGAALGLAVFTTVSVAAANRRFPGVDQALRDAAAGNAPTLRLADALTHGYTAAFLVGSAFMLLSALIIFYAVTTRRTQEASPAAPEAAPAAAA